MDKEILAQPARSSRTDQEHRDCFVCYRGVVYIGHVVEDAETGQEVEVFEPIPCRRCKRS